MAAFEAAIQSLPHSAAERMGLMAGSKLGHDEKGGDRDWPLHRPIAPAMLRRNQGREPFK
jgi:hypothetical protein